MTARNVRGVGLGLRRELWREMQESPCEEIAWLEVHPENYVLRGGRFESILADAQGRWPLVPHGLTLGFGTVAPYDKEYLRRLRGFLDAIDAPWYSDHLCFPGVDGTMLHDLLPVPFVRPAIDLAVRRIAELADAIGRPVALENISWYAHPGPREMEEIDFVLEVLERSDARMLLDVNNVYVNARNHGFDPRTFLDRIPAERVVQIHVAGHLVREAGPIIDTHGEPICDDVYDLLGHTLRRIGPVPVLLERDLGFPPLAELLAELRRLRAIYHDACAAHEASR